MNLGTIPFAEIVEDLPERVDAQPVIVERRADDIDAEPLQFGQRAAIGEFLEDHGVAAVEQHPVDEVEPLARTRGDQHVVGRAVDAAARDLVYDKFADAAEALRPVRVVEREIGAVAAQHRRGRRRQFRRRHMLRVVVAADEIVFRKAGPARRRRRQILGEQMGIGKAVGGHGVFPRYQVQDSPLTGLDPGIHAFAVCGAGGVGGRDKPGHDGLAGRLWRRQRAGACLPETCGVMSG